MNFLQGKNGMERASFDAVWPHLPCLRGYSLMYKAQTILPVSKTAIHNSFTPPAGFFSIHSARGVILSEVSAGIL